MGDSAGDSKGALRVGWGTHGDGSLMRSVCCVHVVDATLCRYLSKGAAAQAKGLAGSKRHEGGHMHRVECRVVGGLGFGPDICIHPFFCGVGFLHSVGLPYCVLGCACR